MVQIIVMRFSRKDKIILGSDYPFPLGELNPPGKVIDSMTNFSKELKVSTVCVFTHLTKIRMETEKLVSNSRLSSTFPEITQRPILASVSANYSGGSRIFLSGCQLPKSVR